jgi:hypothetical protein
MSIKIEVKNYNTVVEFPDGTDQETIKKVLSKNYPPKTQSTSQSTSFSATGDISRQIADTVPVIAKNMWEGTKEWFGGTMQALGESLTKTDTQYDDEFFIQAKKEEIEKDKKHRRQLGLPDRPWGFYELDLDGDIIKRARQLAIQRKKKIAETPGTSWYEFDNKVNNFLTNPGKEIVKESVIQQQKNKEEAGIKPGTLKEFAVDVATGFGETAPALLTTVVTKNPAPLLTYTGLSSFGKTYGEARLQGADQEAAMLASLSSGTIDVTLNMVPVGEMLKPSNQIIKSVIKQAGLEAEFNALGSLLKSAIDIGTITPDLTLEEAFKRAGAEASIGALTGGTGKLLNLTVFKQPEPEPKLSRQAAIEVLEKEGITNPKLFPDVEPRTMTQDDIKKVSLGEIDMPTHENPDSILPKHIETQKVNQILKISVEDKTTQTYRNTIKNNLPDEIIDSYLPEDQFKYHPEKIVEQLETAKKNLETDREATIQRLENGELKDSGIQVMELGILIKEAIDNGNGEAALKYSKLLSEKGTELGRGLRSFQETLKEPQTPADALIQVQKEINTANKIKLKKQPKTKPEDLAKLQPEDVKYITERMEKANEYEKGTYERRFYLYDIKKRLQERIQSAQSGKFLKGLESYMTGNLLWSPDTILVSNTSGNVSRLAYELGDTYFNGFIHWAVNNGDTSALREAQSMAMGFKEGINELFGLQGTLKELWDLHQKEPSKPQSFMEWLVDVIHFKQKAMAILSSDLSDELIVSTRQISSDPLSKEVADSVIGKFVDVFGGAHSLAGDVLSAQDTIQKTIAFNMKTKTEIHRQGELSGLRGVELEAYIRKLTNDIQKRRNGTFIPKDSTPKYAELVEEIYKLATDYKDDVAFQGKFSGYLGEVLDKFNKWPLFKIAVTPFIKTSYNVTKFNIEHFPGMAFLMKTRRENLLGNNGKEAAVRAWSSQVFGTLYWYGLMTAVNQFEITGGHPPEKRKSLQEAKIPEYSIKIGDTWYGYRRYGGLGDAFALGATVKEYWKYYSKEDKELVQKLVSTACSAVDSVTSSTMLKGLKDTLDIVDLRNPDHGGKNVLRYGLGKERALLPFSGLTRGVNRGAIAGVGQDDYFREVNSAIDVINETYRPWVLQPKLDTITGEPIVNEGTLLGATINHTRITEPALMKIAQLELPITEPTTKPFGVQLSAQEYWEYRRTLDTKYHMLDLLNNVVLSPDFQNSPIGIQKKKLLNYINGYRRLAAFNYLQEKARTQEIPMNRMVEIEKMMQPSESDITSETENTLF